MTDNTDNAWNVCTNRSFERIYLCMRLSDRQLCVHKAVIVHCKPFCASANTNLMNVVNNRNLARTLHKARRNMRDLFSFKITTFECLYLERLEMHLYFRTGAKFCLDSFLNVRGDYVSLVQWQSSIDFKIKTH